MLKKIFFVLPLIFTTYFFAQESEDSDVEEVVVVGSQIKGATITGVLPVTVISADDMDAMGIDSGDELLDNIAEFGQNTFNQNEFSGGYNASRGDVGAFNLRDIGTGNTLTLINGRRLVTSPGYQTEPILGGTIPVMTTNSNAIPSYGADRIEILRDGASAIYGADALAGVVNTVLDNDYVGMKVRFKSSAYDGFGAKDNKMSFQWGDDFGKTNISVYLDIYDRDKISGYEDPKWRTMDPRIYPGLSPNLYGLSAWSDTSWRQSNSAGYYGVWDAPGVGSRWHSKPLTDSACDSTSSNVYFDAEGASCLIRTGSSSSSYRGYYNEPGLNDMRPDLERQNLYVFINSELASGVETYTEIGAYHSLAQQNRWPGTTLGAGGCASSGTCTQPYLVPASNYWLNQLVNSDGDKFVDRSDFNPLGLYKARHRFDTPRGYDSHRTTLRFVQGFRGNTGTWDWDTAIVWSQAKSKQNNTGRQSMTLLDHMLALNNDQAYNPFAGPGINDEDPFTISIVRDNYSSLYMWDLKLSNPDVFDLPAGSAGMLIGFEARKESYVDGRDPRISEPTYVVPVGPRQGLAFPLISDVVNSSATPASGGGRTTYSAFVELALPIHSMIDAQLAIRTEDSSDYGDATVGKFAIGFTPIEQVTIRASASETFRAPALILINEGFLGRSTSTNDALLDLAYGDDQLDYSMQRITAGNPGLTPELGENSSIGAVIEPIQDLIITVDKWKIETEDTIGAFGMTNAVLLDALIRAEGGASQCSGNPNVIRSPWGGADPERGPWSSSLCQVGDVMQVNDYYVNNDTRTIEGMDTNIQYSIDTKFGDFGAKVTHVHYDTYEQEAGGDAQRLSVAGGPGGLLEGLAPVRGVDNLLGLDGRIENKYTMKLSWKLGPYQVLVSGTFWDEFFESGHTETIDGVRTMWTVDAMDMTNVTLGYTFDNGLRIRAAVKNLEDNRAPLADEYIGSFWGDLHTDFGRNYSVELYKKF